jgi:stage II sporulation protein D
MTGASWAAAALVCLHLTSLGALPPEIRIADVQPYAAGQQAVRVLVADGAKTIRFRLNGSGAIEDASGARRWVVQAGAAITATRLGGKVSLTARGLRVSGAQFAIAPLKPGQGVVMSAEGGWGRRGFYPGRMQIEPGSSGLRAVESADLETYVAGVVDSEMPSDFPLEAMKAQAIAARTYTLYHLDAHESEDADLCANVHCQAYTGQAGRSSMAARATRETAGQVLTYNGLLVDALYHAACGGTTATAWEVRQGKLLPYAIGEPDAPEPGATPYCSDDHEVSWTRRYSFSEADRLVRMNLPKVLKDPTAKPGRLGGIRLVADPRTGRAEWLKVSMATGTYQVRGDAIRWLFGNGRPGPLGLQSTAFDLSVKADGAGRPRAFTFRGRGHGHGIGLCQWGARGRAMAGQSAVEILSAYYPGTSVVDLERIS